MTEEVDVSVKDDVMHMDDFVALLAKRKNFTKKDIKIILEGIVEIFTEAVLKGQIIQIRSFGKLYHQIIPERKGNKGQILPPADRVVFKLAENIRFAKQGKFSNTGAEEDLDNFGEV